MNKDTSIYIVATYYKKPKDHVNTSKAGWMKDPNNIRYDEQVVITKGIGKKETQAHVIVNLSKKSVERNTLNNNKDFDLLFQYFFTNYSKYITEVMGRLDPEYLQNMVDVMEADLGSMPEDNVVDVPAQVISETVSTK
jgi:hypothetical protein